MKSLRSTKNDTNFKLLNMLLATPRTANEIVPVQVMYIAWHAQVSVRLDSTFQHLFFITKERPETPLPVGRTNYLIFSFLFFFLKSDEKQLRYFSQGVDVWSVFGDFSISAASDLYSLLSPKRTNFRKKLFGLTIENWHACMSFSCN